MFEGIIQNNFLRAFVILLVLLFVTRLILLIVEKIILKLTNKTKTDVDDLLMQKLSKPLTFLAFFFSLIISINELHLSESIYQIMQNFIGTGTILVVAYMLYSVVDIVIIRAVKKLAKKTKSNIDDTLISLFHSALKITLIVMCLLYILSVWGIEIGPLLAGLGIAGLAVALAFQPVLSNIFSGAAMIFDQSIRVKDLVYLDNQVKGKIEKIGLRSTRIRTFDNELIIIPNTKLAESVIQNVALPEPKSRATVLFSVAYGSNVEKVKKLVIKEIKSIKTVSKEPSPIVRFDAMADSSLNFKALFFVDSFEDRADAIDSANTKIYNALNNAKIEIPFPQMDVHVKEK